MFYTITTWRRGRALVSAEVADSALPLRQFLDRMERAPNRVAGTAVFLTADATSTPAAFLHNLKHNKILHERVIVLQVETMDVPRVPDAKRVEVDRLGKGFYSVIAHYGFMEQPDVPAALRACRPHGIAYDEMETSFFLGRETLVPSTRSRLGPWRRDFFISLSHTASATKASSAFRPTAPSSSVTRSRSEGMARPTLVLLPGLLNTRRLFERQIADVADLVDVVVPELWRHDSIGAMAQAALDAAPATFALGGFSMGGYVSLEIMRRAPERVERLA